MKRNLPLYILLIFLIVVNAFFLYNYLGSGDARKEDKVANRSEHFLVKELRFDKSQRESYRALTKSNRIAMRKVTVKIRELKDALFDGLSDDSFGNAKVDSITALIGEQVKQKDVLTFLHFKEVQKLCDEQQKERFSKIIKDAIRREGKPKKPRGAGPNGNRPPPPHKR